MQRYQDGPPRGRAIADTDLLASMEVSIQKPVSKAVISESN